jgi:hypothetical protein
MQSRPGAALTALLFAVSTADSQGQGGARHPLREFRRIPAAGVKVARVGDASRERESAERVMFLTPDSSAVRIGTESGPPETVFGSIGDVKFDDAGNLVILDSRLNELRVFSTAGKHLQTFARPGNGPGELRAPRAVATAGNGRVFVADAGSRVHLYQRNGGAYKYVRSAPVGVDPSALCVMHDTLYVQGASLSDSTVIHRFNLNLEHAGSFGVVYRSGSPMIDFQVARGRIACAPARGDVAFATAALMGEVRLFGADRSTRWVTDFVDYKPISLIVRPDGSFEASVPEDGYNRMRSLVQAEPGALLAQVSVDTRASRAEKRAFEQLYTYRIEIESGTASFVSRSLPLLAAVNATHAVFQTEDPVPAVIVQRLKRGAR